MTLKYSDGEVTDEELRELNLQIAVQKYMRQQDTQNEIPHFHFSKTELLHKNFDKRMTDTSYMARAPG